MNKNGRDMTTTEAAAEAPPELRCHRCHGSGLEPMPKPPSTDGMTAEQQAVLAALSGLGQNRARANRHTLAGRQNLDEAYREIRVQAAEGTRLGIQTVRMAEAVGVSRAQMYNILNGSAGTS